MVWAQCGTTAGTLRVTLPPSEILVVLDKAKTMREQQENGKKRNHVGWVRKRKHGWMV